MLDSLHRLVESLWTLRGAATSSFFVLLLALIPGVFLQNRWRKIALRRLREERPSAWFAMAEGTGSTGSVEGSYARMHRWLQDADVRALPVEGGLVASVRRYRAIVWTNRIVLSASIVCLFIGYCADRLHLQTLTFLLDHLP